MRKSTLILVALCAILTTACNSEKGIPLYKEYPVLTQERKEEIENWLVQNVNARIVADASNYATDPDSSSRHPDRPVIPVDGMLREWINHLDRFMQADKVLDGVSYPGIENVQLAVVGRKKLKEICGESAGACNGEGLKSDLIVMPDNWNILIFLPVLFHEIGHTYFHGSEEFPAKGNEIYMALKAYQFSEPVGSRLIHSVLDGVGRDDPNSYSAFSRMYAQGTMYGIICLINNNGDLEATTDDVAHSLTLIVETEILQKLAETPGETNADKYFYLWNELLELPGFYHELIGPTGHLSNYKTHELRQYLKILNHKHHRYLTGKWMNFELFNWLCASFLSNSNFHNPYFKEKVLAM